MSDFWKFHGSMETIKSFHVGSCLGISWFIHENPFLVPFMFNRSISEHRCRSGRLPVVGFIALNIAFGRLLVVGIDLQTPASVDCGAVPDRFGGRQARSSDGRHVRCSQHQDSWCQRDRPSGLAPIWSRHQDREASASMHFRSQPA